MCTVPPCTPGFCELGVSWQSLENPHMKAALSMPKGLTGVYITKTEPMFEASRILKQGDVLCSFNGACGCRVWAFMLVATVWTAAVQGLLTASTV